jgi:molecular chaperone HtpG
LVKRYSDFVGYPIKAAVPAPDAKVDAAPEERVLNSMQPIWTRPAADVTDEEFTEFYRHVARDWGEPLDRLALRAEGRLEYQALLFVPAHAPFDLYFRDQQFGLQLYVRRVLIMDRCQNLLPPYLRFVKGIVDAADLPLNVSREMIQQDRHIGQMQSWLSRKVLDHLKQLLESDREKFRTLWGEFGPVLKEGVAGEGDVRDRLLPLLLFQSSHNPSALTTLDEYVARMKPEQTEIYYLTGESRAVVEHSPHLEAFQSKGYEVLYLVDPVDELVAERVQEFSGKPVKSVGKGTVELGSEDERKQAEADLSEQRKRYGSLLEFLQTTLADEIKEARLSSRLTTSPVCLVGADGDLSPALERMLRRSQGADAVTQQKRILEVNPKHPIAAKLQERFEANQDDSVLVDYAQLLLGYALLAEGSELPDPARFNRAIGDLMVKGL